MRRNTTYHITRRFQVRKLPTYPLFIYCTMDNWRGGLSQDMAFSTWTEKAWGHEKYFFFRRESKALFRLVIYGTHSGLQVGFRQEDGRGCLSPARYHDLEEAKAAAVEFFKQEFFVKGLERIR